MRNSSTSCFQNPMPKLRNESRFLLVVGFLTLAPRLFADGGVGRTIGLHPHKEPKLRGFSASLLPRGGKERAMYTNPDVEAPNGIELAVAEKALFAFEPISRSVPTLSRKHLRNMRFRSSQRKMVWHTFWMCVFNQA